MQQVFAVSTQHRHLLPGQACGQHQAIEAVVFSVATPDCSKRFFKFFIKRVHIQRAQQRLHFELLNPRQTGFAIHPVGVFGDHAQAHVFHHWQRIGQRNILQLAIQLEAHVLLARIDIQRQAQILRAGQCRDVFHVVGGDVWADIFDITCRQGIAIAGREPQAGLLTVARYQTFTQLIAPIAHDFCQPSFQRRQVNRDLVMTLAGANDDVHLRQRRIADLHIGIHAIATQRIA